MTPKAVFRTHIDSHINNKPISEPETRVSRCFTNLVRAVCDGCFTGTLHLKNCHVTHRKYDVSRAQLPARKQSVRKSAAHDILKRTTPEFTIAATSSCVVALTGPSTSGGGCTVDGECFGSCSDEDTSALGALSTPSMRFPKSPDAHSGQ